MALLILPLSPLIKLWYINSRKARIPPALECRRMTSLINYRDVVLDETRNYAFLQRAGQMVDLGGNVATLESKPDGSPFISGFKIPGRE